jgi:uncharacterized protein YhaN
MNELKNSLKQFSELNENIHSIEKQLQELKKKRESYEYHILNLIERENLKDKDIRIGNCKYQYHISNKRDNLSQQFLKTHLYNYFIERYKVSNEQALQKSQEILEYLLNKRSIKEDISLKCIKMI